MSKGTEAISILRSYFGERVDPGQALALLFAKLESQNEIMGRLKNLCCGLAFDAGVLEGFLKESYVDSEVDLDKYFALPRCELRAEVVEPTQPPSRIIT